MEKWKTYICQYYHNGKWWGLDIVAPNLEDAAARVAKLGNLQLQGELKISIPVKNRNPIVQFFVMSWCSIMNFLTKL